nr:hypothetical protein [Panacagrimonas perspica]
MVIRGGENIYPREIEEFLYTHADFAEVHVVGVPDSKFGEEFVACVRLREGADVLSAESLKSYCEGRIARYKVPKYVRCMDSFPMTVTGKVRKAELREQCRPWVTSSPESV